MTETLSFDELLRQAGAVMTERGGRRVPAHYGSAAGELAVCLSAVGLADRSDLTVLSITAAPHGLDQLLRHVLDRTIEPQGAALQSGTWWCRAGSGTELIAICPAARAEHLKTTLRHDVNRLPHGSLTDLSASRVALNIIGRHTHSVLADLGVHGPAPAPHHVAPFTDAPILGHPATWLLESPAVALALVEIESAGPIWRAIETAGLRYGISCVGLEAITRYTLSQLGAGRTVSLV